MPEVSLADLPLYYLRVLDCEGSEGDPVGVRDGGRREGRVQDCVYFMVIIVVGGDGDGGGNGAGCSCGPHLDLNLEGSGSRNFRQVFYLNGSFGLPYLALDATGVIGVDCSGDNAEIRGESEKVVDGDEDKGSLLWHWVHSREVDAEVVVGVGVEHSLGFESRVEPVQGGRHLLRQDGDIERRVLDVDFVLVDSEPELVVACSVGGDDGRESEGLVLSESRAGPEQEVLDGLVEFGAVMSPTSDMVFSPDVLEVDLIHFQYDMGDSSSAQIIAV